MTESMHRRPRHNGDEQDAFSRNARRLLCCLDRAGVVHKTKKRAARRDRHTTRQGLRLAGHWGSEMLHAASRADLDAIVTFHDLVSA